MNKIAIKLLTLLALISCNRQVKQNDHTEETQPKYQDISKYSISLGKHNSILHCIPTINNNHLLYVRIDNNDNINKENLYVITINSKGDSINSLPIKFNNIHTDYIECNHFYYIVHTDSRTMGGDSKDFLNKYDKNWKLIWSKKIGKPKFPGGFTVLTLTKNNEILLIANELKGISIRLYNLDGKLISENSMLTNGCSNPISIIKSYDNNFYLTAEKYDQTTKITSLWLMKLTQKGDTIWTKKYPQFCPKQTILTNKGHLIFYGSYYSSPDEQNINYEFLKILAIDTIGNLKWVREIKQNYYERPGNFFETNSGNYLFSATITPLKDQSDFPYLFEINKNGVIIFQRKFDYQSGIGSVPFIFKGQGQIIMIGQKWIGKFGYPFKDVIQITKLTE